jgi:hypothetical protein
MFGFELCLDYDTELPTIRSILARSQKTQWTLDEIPWADTLKGDDYLRVLDWQGLMRSSYIRGLSKKKLKELARQFVAFEFSQILHGEQGAMMLAGQLTNCLDDLDARIFAATQAKDEARHVEAGRAIIQRLGPVYPCGTVLQETLEGLLESRQWTKQVLGLQLFLEARALLSFRQQLLFVDDPVFKEAVIRIERDEAQHVAFGIRYMKNGVSELSHAEREELVKYALWLDQNVWRMTQSHEYRAPFDECDLDYSEFRRTQERVDPMRPQLTVTERKTVRNMMGQFQKWFHRALVRTEIVHPGETIAGIDIPKDILEGNYPQLTDREYLPWTNTAD